MRSENQFCTWLYPQTSDSYYLRIAATVDHEDPGVRHALLPMALQHALGVIEGTQGPSTATNTGSVRVGNGEEHSSEPLEPGLELSLVGTCTPLRGGCDDDYVEGA